MSDGQKFHEADVQNTGRRQLAEQEFFLHQRIFVMPDKTDFNLINLRVQGVRRCLPDEKIGEMSEPVGNRLGGVGFLREEIEIQRLPMTDEDQAS